ncbi:hypothetical protein ATK86_0069 [Nocardia fluminea]|uniref:Uncharacterized protein n=1 Tax=Nocardia fluminea TaxID=134984 RepID=A0A2N3WW14_9NOCA|nr:hypothetical protein ATK86_0069 [Nocardia fluminea]
MTVCEVGRIDQVAVGANGRLIVAMTDSAAVLWIKASDQLGQFG